SAEAGAAAPSGTQRTQRTQPPPDGGDPGRDGGEVASVASVAYGGADPAGTAVGTRDSEGLRPLRPLRTGGGAAAAGALAPKVVSGRAGGSPAANGNGPHAGAIDPAAYTLVRSPEALSMVVATLDEADAVGLDTETTGLDPRTDRVRLLSLGLPTTDCA